MVTIRFSVDINSSNIGLGCQLLRLRHHFPEFRAYVTNSHLVVTGDLSPTPLSYTYRFRMVYSLASYPKVHIIKPDLTLLAGKRSLPHVYRGNSLCLFLPGSQEWNSSMFLSDSIIPMIADWLRFFEWWLITETWHGGGIHPEPEHRNLPRSLRRYFIRRHKNGLQNFIN
jgi:hypothetical protein